MVTVEEWDRPALHTLIGKKNLVGAEIGVAKGINAVNILKYLDIKKLYLIDPYIAYGNNAHGVFKEQHHADAERSIAEKSLAGEDRVYWINEYSAEAVKLIDDNSLDFVYIDGNHTYNSTLNDIQVWEPKVKSGGLLAGHDYKSGEAGVIRAVNRVYKDFETGVWDWWVIK